MSSSIFFKFKSQKEPSAITFDGTSLSVFEVKREIIAYNKLGDGTDFDLEIYSADTNEVYEDDTVQIPRSTTVVARRLPAAKPGAGRAARYVSGKMPVTAKNQHRIEAMHSTSATGSSTPSAQASVSSKPLTEEEKLAAMFSESKAALQEASAEIAAKGVNNRPFFPIKTNAAAPDKPVPDGYICHRCGQKGHWIQACPTNSDPKLDGRPRFRKTTGIPRSSLQKVELNDAMDEDGKVDVSKLPAGVMYTPEGEWVVARPDEASWRKFQEKTKATAEQQKLAGSELDELRERGLLCPLSNTLFNDPVKTPCCSTTYSRTAIEDELIEHDLACPNCGKQVLLDDLKADDETNTKIKEYKDDKAALTKAEADDASLVVTQQAESESPTSGELPAEVNTTTPTSSKKRAAEDDDDGELDKDRPNGNKMQKSCSKDGTPTKIAAAAPQPALQVPKNTADFMAQMNQMFGGMQNPAAFNNPMMMNPMMMQQMMAMGMPGMPGMPMMPGMIPGMMPNMMMPGMPPMPMPGQAAGWQGNQQQQQQQGQQGGGGAYFRQPVNGGRQRGRQNRPRSTDYKQL